MGDGDDLARDEALIAAHPPLRSIVGPSAVMRRLRRWVVEHARESGPVLLMGESGVGHATVACALHDISGRPSFAAVPWGAYHPDALLTALHAAAVPHASLFVPCAEPGTWKDAALDLSAKHEMRMIVGCLDPLRGGSWSTRLAESLAGTLRISPLRERAQDIAELTRAFLARADAPEAFFSERALERLRRFAWPGNVRELEHAVIRAASIAGARQRAGHAPLTVRDLSYVV